MPSPTLISSFSDSPASWRRVIRAKLSKEHFRFTRCTGQPLGPASSASCFRIPGGPGRSQSSEDQSYYFRFRRQPESFHFLCVTRRGFAPRRLPTLWSATRFSAGPHHLLISNRRQPETFVSFRLSPFPESGSFVERDGKLSQNQGTSTRKFALLRCFVRNSKVADPAPSCEGFHPIRAAHTLRFNLGSSTQFFNFSVGDLRSGERRLMLPS